MVVATPISTALSSSVKQHLFPSHLELVPQLNEVYELELAYLESRILNDEEIIHNGGYFARVGDTLTRHFLMCSGEPVRLPQHSSSRLRSFFQTNQFKTGYATHGLFPYRGKFHPQMIKGLLNVMGLKRGETVLDPMMGSGTVLIEASLMGIASVGLDASPFCKFMTQAKIDGLTVPAKVIRIAFENARAVFDHFARTAGHPIRGSKKRTRPYTEDLLSVMERESSYRNEVGEWLEHPRVHNLLLLAYLDSAGYSERSDRVAPYDQFRAILERYVVAVEKIQRVLEGVESELGEARVLDGDARSLPLESSSIDGIVFSPPYSFAIDYLENDSFHLRFMGVDTERLRETMIGLRGNTPREKLDLYRSDMDKIMSECAKVLRPGRICVVVVGTNNNQLGKILGISPGEVEGINNMIINFAQSHGLRLVRSLARQITGMANVMRDEYILMFQRH